MLLLLFSIPHPARRQTVGGALQASQARAWELGAAHPIPPSSLTRPLWTAFST